MRSVFKLVVAGAVSAATLAAAGSAGAVVVGFGGTKLPGADPLGDAFSTNTVALFFDMGPEKFNTGSFTFGDGLPIATIFQFTLNNGVKNGIKLTAANTFFKDITTGQIWAPTFSTIAGNTQRVTFTAPGLSFIKPNDLFQAKISFVKPLDTKRYSWSANWDNTVPEPASWALMLSGFGLAGVALRRRRRRPVVLAA